MNITVKNIEPYKDVRIEVDRNNIDLGSACGRYHRVAILGISDAGDSDILTLFETK